MKKEEWEAISILMGTVIGAGVLGIPYIVYKSGFLTGFLVIIFLGLAVMLMNLFTGEIALSTNGNHQLTGYAERYLGKKGKIIMTLSMLIGIYGALIAYIIGVGEALHAIFNVWNSTIFSLMFFAVVAFFVFKGMRWVFESEFWVAGSTVLLILIICMIAFWNKNYSLEHLKSFNLAKIFIPYGVILFAYLGTSAIPEMREELRRNRKLMKKCIIIGGLIPVVVYSLFAAAVIGLLGGRITEVATLGLREVLGGKIVLIANLFAVLAMSTSFLALGLALREMFNYDYKFNKNISWALTVFLPLGLFLIGVKSFINTIGIAGSFAGGIDGILIVFMLWKAKKLKERKPEYKLKFTKIIGVILIIVFTLGILYQILDLLKFI